MRESRRMALCGMLTALCVVLMLLGAMLELGMYASPLFAGLCLIPAGDRLGRKYHLLMWLVVSILSFILVPNIEESLIFFALFGCYPMFRSVFHRFGKWACIALKLIYFNVVVVALEALVMLVLVPESLGLVMNILLLVLGNITFIAYDFLIPRATVILGKYMGRWMK